MLKKNFLCILPTIKLLDDHDQLTLTGWPNKKEKDCLSSPSKGSVGRVHKPVRRYLGWRDRFDWMCQVGEKIGWWMRRVSVNKLLCILGNICMIKGHIKWKVKIYTTSRVKNTKMHGNYIKKLTAKKYNKTGNKQGPRVTRAKKIRLT